MVRTRVAAASGTRHPSTGFLRRSDIPLRRRRAIATAAIIIVLSTALAAIESTWNHIYPEPYHTCILTGRAWVQELLDGHRDRMRDSLGTRPSVFLSLESELIRLGGLQPSRWVDTTEKLAIFLYQAATNNSVRKVAERFQRSNETISRCVDYVSVSSLH